MSVGPAIAIGLVLLLANAFFVAVEFALIATQRSQIEDRANSGDRRAKRALSAITDLNTQIAGAQLGITISTLALGLIAEPSIAKWLEHTVLSDISDGARHTIGLIIALTIVTFLHILVGEMVPKNIALADAPKTSIWLAPTHGAFVRIARPLVNVLNGTAIWVLRLMGVEALDERAQAKTPEELNMLLNEAYEDEVLDDYELTLLSNTLELGEQSVQSALVPWAEVATASADAPIREIESIMAGSGHSRLALTNDSGAPIGWVHAKDLLAVDTTLWDEPLPQHRKRRLLELSPETAVEDALEQMQAARQHFALASSGGEAVGIITLEDVLEVLVSGLVGTANS